MVLGVCTIFTSAFYYEKTLLHAPLQSLLGALMLVGAQYTMGLTSNSFIYHSLPHIRQYIIGRQISFENSKNIRPANFHKNKIIIRFVAHKSERFLAFFKK